jgi:hypothetical protein
MVDRHAKKAGHNPPGNSPSPPQDFKSVDKRNIRPPGEFYLCLPGQGTELEKEKPQEKLGFPPIGMPKRNNAAAFSLQGPLIGIEKGLAVP